MRVFIILSILGICLVYCNGSENATSDVADNSTKSTMGIPRISDSSERYKKGIDVHESLLHRLLLPEWMHEEVKKSPLMPFSENLTDVPDNETKKNPKNVILVLVEGTEGDDQWLKFKKNLTLYFSEGVLQKCSERVFSNESFENGEGNCQWKQKFMDSINGLLLWARQIKEMNIGTVSGGNFTLPSVFHFENPPLLSPKIFNEKPQEVPLSFLEQESKFNNYSVNNFPGNVNHSGMRIPLTLNPYPTEGEGNEVPWDFLDVISRIRFAVFQTFLDSLHGAFGGNEEDMPSSGIFPDRFHRDLPGIVNIIANTLQDLQTISSENGYLLIAVASSQELLDISEFLRQKTSTNDTLLILTGLQNYDDRGIPIFASGPGSTLINATHTISDIPKLIKSSLEKPREIHQDRPPLSLPLHDTPRRRVARSDDDDEMSDAGGEMSLDENSAELSSSEPTTDNDEGTTAEDYPEPRLAQSSCALGFSWKFLHSLGFITPIISLLEY